MATAIEVTVLLLTVATAAQAYLQVSGGSLYYKGQKVFLSGANYAWKDYGRDFGNNKYNLGSKSTYVQWLQNIADAGGNSVRIWIHAEGFETPAFDANGYVTKTDSQSTLPTELKSFLDAAKSKNIFVIPVLWNGAYMTNKRYIDLLWDDAKLVSYINNALKPMVAAVKGHPALAAWEVVNEPEGSIRNNAPDANPCFDTTPLNGSGAGWTGAFIPMKNWLKFINWQIAAIKEVDPAAIATQGAWSEKSQTSVCSGCRNYFTDACLRAAGGKTAGTIAFYQMHTYSNDNKVFNPYSPMKVFAGAYKLDKPVVIGEFSAVCSEGNGIRDLFQRAYTRGYAGAWSWQWNGLNKCSDTAAVQAEGMRHIKAQENAAYGILRVTIS